MLKTVFNFANNRDFHNVADKPSHALLSRKERAKVALARFGQVSLFALSVGMTAITAGPEDAAASVGIFAGLTAAFRYRAVRAEKRRAAYADAYDLTQSGDLQSFADNYPEQPHFPAYLLEISKEAGLKNTPRLIVSHEKDATGIIDFSVFKKEQDLALIIERRYLRTESPELVAHIAAHEIGHAKFEHTNHTGSIFSATAIATHLKAGAEMALSGNYLGGLGYMVAASIGHIIAYAKAQQYNERICDRYALVASGVTKEAAVFFLGETVELPKDAPPSLRAGFAAIDTVQSLFGNHPGGEKRADYIIHYEGNNWEKTRKTREKRGLSLS